MSGPNGAPAEAPGLLQHGRAYTVDGWRGIAWRYVGDDTAPDADTDWTGFEAPTGRVRLVMVGDDTVHTFEPAECAPLDRAEFCAECGQIGCTADGAEAEE